MQQRLAPEASEDRFRKFSAELLAVEEVGFSDGFFYSPDALRKILERFCNIIAENLYVQSCTVQLKLYDSFNSSLLKRLLESEGELLTSSDIEKPKNCTGEARLLWENFSRNCIKRYYEVVGTKPEQVKFRQALMKNSMIFPYALYPKGALWLVASNENGPWAKCAPWLISQINRGIMTQIIQDKAARVRDRMSLRQTRSHRKLGPLDPYIWTNQSCTFDDLDQPSPLYFFNYYGVPIRIHQRGDVIGILRVENKGLGAKAPNTFIHEVLNRVLDMSLDGCEEIDKFATQLHAVFQGYKDEIAASKDFEPQEISLLSLAYLAHDLATARRPSDQAVRDLCTLPYIGTNNAQTTATGFADSEDSERAPVQITFDNSEEERAFVKWLSAERTTNIFLAVKIFYGKLNEMLKATLPEKVVSESIEQALVEAINEVRRCDTKLEPSIERVELPSLHHLVKLDIPGEKRFRFYLQLTPTRAELKEERFAEHWGFTKEIAARYQRVNSPNLTLTADDLEFHLPTDRLAARIEALTLAFPIPKFTVHDAWWLSWAALEIGKLIERQISYRGTNISPTVPLTAMDFFRVPISDLSFVDALRSQYKDAETVKGMLEYHIPNHCRELDLEVTLEHNCRVKNFRSYLERLGQEHRAHYDALIATWLYILHLRLAEWNESRLLKALDEHKQECRSSTSAQGWRTTL
jgi:hypothetical protein